MDDYTSQPAPQINIRAVLKDKKVRVALIITAVVLFGVWVLQGLFGTMYGVSGVSMSESGMYLPSAPIDSGVFSNSKGAPSRVAMDYDESYAPMPSPAPQGGTGSYEEQEYETRSYTATIKTGEYDATIATIESWKPLPYVMFESANRGERSAYYRLKVESARADEVLKAIDALSPADLTQQTDIIKKQLLNYTTRLDVLTKQEELLTDMLTEVNAAYDELVTLSKDKGDVKTLASVIDDKVKYINQLSQQRLSVSNQIDVIAQQKAELADRIEYVYFTITVTKYEFINGDQLKDSWVAKTQTFVRQTNALLQTMTLGLISFMVWLLQALLYIVVIGTVALFVTKHGYRAVTKYWRS